MKYIDADLLRGKISEQMESLPREVGRGAGTITSKGYGMMEAFQIIRSIIDSLQEEQPSLPSNLDEAAEETAQKYYCSCLEKHNETGICDGCENIKLSFKAGAKWMAEQGETQGHFVIGSIAGSPCGPAVVCYTEEFEIGDQVIVQIRKKEENHE